MNGVASLNGYNNRGLLTFLAHFNSDRILDGLACRACPGLEPETLHFTNTEVYWALSFIELHRWLVRFHAYERGVHKQGRIIQ